MEQLESREFQYEFSRWPGRYLIQSEYICTHLEDRTHYGTCVKKVCAFCATGGRLGSGNGARWLNQSTRYCHQRHENRLVNIMEDPDYCKDESPVQVRSVAIPSEYQASPDATLSGVVRNLGNIGGITDHCAQAVLQDPLSQLRSGPAYVKVMHTDGTEDHISLGETDSVEGAVVR